MDIEEYEREGRAAYAALAVTISTILAAAIGVEVGYRLQQIKERAKHPTSLRKKLEQRGIPTTTTLENDIKDLAGCRVIFYTNSDVTRFINSGIIQQNFEVIEVKLHYPGREAKDAAELYMSDHFLVRLRPERIALPEYGHYAGMRCEIQIQTILNHAWAEMAHDTIYKVLSLGDFGGKAFNGIKNRMQKVARKYLLPAGYEFQKIASDFQRLIEGKALFDGDALEAIVEAADNNIRAEAIETFAENVLPLYDDLQTVYPEVVERLMAGAKRARETPPIGIETPYGELPAKNYGGIVESIVGILTIYRYLDVEATFDALRTLYLWAGNEDERKPMFELGKALAKHNLVVWRQSGPVVQEILVERIGALSEDECRRLEPLLTVILGEMLSAEVSGTTTSSTTMMFHQGAVVSSEALREVRAKAIVLLKRQFTLAEVDEERSAILLALQSATRPPLGAGYTKALARQVMDDTISILYFQAEIAPTMDLQLLETTEDWVNHCFWRFEDLPEKMRDDPDLVAVCAGVRSAALAFRDVANADSEFVIYKTLVGFKSVFPPAWEDKNFRYGQAEMSFRNKKVDALLASVEETCADAWFDRISRFAETKSEDLATFPVFGDFLYRLSEAQPRLISAFIDRLKGPITNFLPNMLAGLMRSADSADVLVRIDAWLCAGEHIGHIAWYQRNADPFDESLLCRTLDSAILHGDAPVTRIVLSAAVLQFAAHPSPLVVEIFLRALSHLEAAGDYSWVRMQWFPWLNSPIIRALDEEQANLVLKALVPYPQLEHGAEFIAAAIAERWPANVVAFIGKRQTFKLTDTPPPSYNAFPFAVHQLQPPLAAAPDAVLSGARNWFNASPGTFTYGAGMLIASVFPNLADGLETRLEALISSGDEEDLAFVLGVLSAFEGKPCIYSLVRAIVAGLNPESPLLKEAESVLHKTGVVSGNFGFADLLVERKRLIETWLADSNEKVRKFAADHIRELDRGIALENRSAEASIAFRKLAYGEELTGGEEGPSPTD